jgi:hypothetical protein
MKKFLILTLTFLCSSVVFGQTEKTSKITNEEYAVYMAVLGADNKDFVVENESRMDGLYSKEIEDEIKNYLKISFKEIKPETLEDFEQKNKESFPIEKKFPTKANYTLLNKKDWGETLNWDNFQKKIPNSVGLYIFSRVGFSKEGTQALVFVASYCGELCGKGNYYFLKKENGEWKIVSELNRWVS